MKSKSTKMKENPDKVYTLYRQNLQKKILKMALQMFLNKGIKLVRMDDIANHLSISKRTLYEIYGNKEELLMECIKEQHRQFASFFDMKNEKDVIQIIINFLYRQIEDLRNTNPRFFKDLNKYPHVTRYLERHRFYQQKEMMDFVQKAIEDGYFRPDVNYDIIFRVSNASMRYTIGTNMYKEYPIEEIFRQLLFVYFRGFCTEKGLERFNRLTEERLAKDTLNMSVKTNL